MEINSEFPRVQKRRPKDTNNIYSVHEPDALCIGKGKEQKKYEFSRKASLAVTKTTSVVAGHCSSREMSMMAVLCLKIWSRHGRSLGPVSKPIEEERHAFPMRKARELFRIRAGIEPVIGHVEHAHRMARNFLKGALVDAINFRKWMRRLVRLFALTLVCPFAGTKRVPCRHSVV